MSLFTQWCGYSLALSHARSGESALISGYLGKSDVFDKAVAAFSVAYAPPERVRPRRAQTCDPRGKGRGGHRRSEVSGPPVKRLLLGCFQCESLPVGSRIRCRRFL